MRGEVKHPSIISVGALLSVLLSGLTSNTTRGSPPDIAAPTHKSFGGSSWSVNSWSNVQIEYRLASWFGRCRIVIDNIAYIPPRIIFTRYTPNKPVMSIKWRGATCMLATDYSAVDLPEFLGVHPTHPLKHGCSWCSVLRTSHEPHKSRLLYACIFTSAHHCTGHASILAS